MLILFCFPLFASPAGASRDNPSAIKPLPAPNAGPYLQDAAITYLRYDVDITLKPDGNFIVREIQQIKFQGKFSTAFAEIPLDYTKGIDHVQLWEGNKPYLRKSYAGSPGTFTQKIHKSQNVIAINWRFEETAPGDVRTFTLQYEVSGGLWVYPDETILEWRAVPADRSGFTVLNSRVTISLPENINPNDVRYTAYGPDFSPRLADGQITFTATQAIPDGTRFQVQVGFPPDAVPAKLQPWQIAEDNARLEYRLEAIDVHLAIDKNGQLAVTEQQRVAVDAGALYSGNRTIELAYLDDIDDISVFEGEQPFSLNPSDCESYCLKIRRPWGSTTWIWYDDDTRSVVVDEAKAGELTLNWYFPALVKGEATTFRLQYRVLGAVQFEQGRQRLNWTVVFPGRDVPVQSASVRIELPPGTNWEDVSVRGGNLRHFSDGGWGLVHPGPVKAGQPWQISLLMPANATDAPKPAWQTALENAHAEARQAEIRRARLQLGAAVAAVLILIGGLLAAGLIWYLRGRDRPPALVVDYLTEPPSNLPPGIVAYLVDENLTPKGALASLFHLATLGLLRIDLTEGIWLQLNWNQDLADGQTLQLPSGETVAVPEHLVTLFNRLRPHIPHDKVMSLWHINKHFQHALPFVYADMVREATRFFTELPRLARHRWMSVGQWMVVGGVIGTVLAWFIFIDDLGWVALTPTVALLPVGAAFMLVSRWMPQRTSAGVEEAARWRAFRRYLRNLKQFGSLAEAQQILDNHFAYAVALDVEELVLEQAEDLGGTMPAWTQTATLSALRPLPGPEPDTAHRDAPGKPTAQQHPGQSPPPLKVLREQPAEKAATTTPAESATRPSLQGMSRRLGKTLADASTSVGNLLNTAAGNPQDDTPFTLILKGAGKTAEVTWDITASTAEVVGDILESSSGRSGSGGYSGKSGGSSWSRGSRSGSTRWSSRSSRSSSRFSGRSSSSRRSGGGGRRGFG